MSLPHRPRRSQIVALLSASSATSMANMAQTTVLGLVVYRLTDSELDLGILGLAEFAPAALLVFVAGAVVDRFDLRTIAALGAATNAAVAVALSLYLRHPHHLRVAPILLLVLAFGIGQAFLSPAERAIPAAMAPPEHVPLLVAQRNVAGEAAMILGPVLGGFLFAAGAWVPLAVVAGLSAIGAGATLFIRLAPAAPAPAPEAQTDLRSLRDEEVSHVLEEGIPPSGGSWREAMAGLGFVRRHPILLGAISLDLFAVLLGGAVTLLPAIAVRLHTGAIGLGWLRAATGIGAGSMTLFLSFRPVRRRVGRVLLAVVAIFGVWTIVLGITRSYAVAFVAILALSAADAVSMFIRSTLVPLATPADMRGRVLAVENVFIGASNQLGGFESGLAGQFLGTTGSVVLGGIGTLVVALVWGVLFAPLRRLDTFPAPPPHSELAPPDP